MPVAQPVVRCGSDGSGAPTTGLLAALVLALLALVLPATAAADTLPTVSGETASEVGVTTAKLSGQVNPNGTSGDGNTTWRLQYSPAGEETWTNANEGTIEPPASEEANPVGVEAIFGFSGELQPGHEYEYRLVAKNGAGQVKTPLPYPTFTMDAAATPALTIEPVTVFGYTTAHLVGTVDPEGGNVNPVGPETIPIHWEFQVSTDGGSSWSPALSGDITEAEAEGSTPITVEGDAANLSPGTPYEVRLHAVATNFGSLSVEADSPGPNPGFTTLTVAKPTVSIEPVTTFAGTTAHFAGHVDPNGTDPAFEASWSFTCVPACPGFEGGTVPADGASHEVEVDATGLEPHTSYTVTLHATNLGGESTAAAAPFTTDLIAPIIGFTYSSEPAATTATLNAQIQPGGAETTYHFEYVTEADFQAHGFAGAATTPATALGASDNTIHLATTPVAGLMGGTSYRFRAIASNSSGTTTGPARTFSAAAGSCPNEARRLEQESTYLPACRAYELTTPDTGIDIMGDSSRTVAAAGEAAGLPMAVKFSALGGMGDASGGGTAFDYLSQRDGNPGTSGWRFRGITPMQGGSSYWGGISSVDPLYELFSPDLTQGVFRALASLPGTSANAKEVPDLYLRDDLRTAGIGSYQLLTDSSTPQAPLIEAAAFRPWIAGVSSDMRHVLFESQLNLTSDATGPNTKLYRSDDGVVHLITANGSCAGQSVANAVFPCSRAGLGSTLLNGGPARDTPHVISDDGSRVNFMTPFGTAQSTTPNSTPGLVSRLYQVDDGGTSASDDDALIQLSMSENPSPETAQAAVYRTASADGSRVFFTSDEQLTATPGSGLYMWERQDENETQELAVDATGGDLTLTAHSQPSYGSGTLTENSTEVTGVTGSFTVGQTISAPGIPVGTTVAKVATSGETIFLSAEATESVTEALTASFENTTGPLPWNATAADVQSALEALDQIGTGNVAVSGGPGSTAPLEVEFTGGLAGVDVMQLTADAGGLTGGSATASVHTTNGVENLSLIGQDASALIGASEDGHRVYFSRGDSEIWYWEDADGVAGGTLSHVASLPLSDLRFQVLGPPGNVFWNVKALDARVTPDGRALLFIATDGAELPPHYQHGVCVDAITGANQGQCSELYLYQADSSTPTEPDIVCASCDLSQPGLFGNSFLNAVKGVGSSLRAQHLSRALTEDGSRVFFDTEAALVAEDTNNAVDVYEYDVDRSTPRLISGGTDSAPSYLMDASANGSDVFFVTRARLSGWDDDQVYDLYDARVGGGFLEPPAGSDRCSGTDGCRSALAVPPPPSTNGSGSVNGPGDPRRACPRDTRAVRKGGRVRCVKKQSRKHHQKKHRRAASDNGRAGK
ncbi:MAG TPA: hypothetical protein VLL27_08760 [Solirubrobacterales bacterium]|nr:hypothetical protein [Solirubrobacterales bacterium]